MQEVFDILREKLNNQKENDKRYELYASSQEVFNDVIKMVNQVEEYAKANMFAGEWFDVEYSVPSDNRYILLSFENYSIPLIGQYEEDDEGGAFYAGDEDISLISQDMIVNAWTELPQKYNG